MVAHQGEASRQLSVSRLGRRDTAQLAARVAVPTAAVGLVRRRPRITALEERLNSDRAAIDVLVQLRERYGTDMLWTTAVGHSFGIPISRPAVRHILEGSPDPFTPASAEKRAALTQFQPHGLLISSLDDRPERRRLNEHVLDADASMHSLASSFTAVTAEEASTLIEKARAVGALAWSDFNATWWRIVRGVVFGDVARGDSELIGRLNQLRRGANWSFLGRRRQAVRRRFEERLRELVTLADRGSLAAIIRDAPTGDSAAIGQIPHWLFAFDAAGIVVFRTLALLASHPEQREKALTETVGSTSGSPDPLPYLRGCVLESVRLWPTTPALLRQSLRPTTWGDLEAPTGTTFLIHTPFFHRDVSECPDAHRFSPEIWLDGRADDDPALVPFSGGAASCPGRNLVLMVASTLLAEFFKRADYDLSEPGPLSPGRLPETLDHFGLRFAVT